MKLSNRTKEEVQEHLTETIWIVAEAYGANRDCEGCRTVVRRHDRREKPETVCLLHARVSAALMSSDTIALDPIHPQDCDHGGADSFGLPGCGELLWCTQCGSIQVVSEGHEHPWELPYWKRSPRGRTKKRTVKRRGC